MGDMVRVFFDMLLLNFMNPFRAGDGQAASGNTEIIRGDSQFPGRACNHVAVKKVRGKLKQFPDLFFQ